MTRSICADPNPKGPGIIEQDASEWFHDEERKEFDVNHQSVHRGSYAQTKSNVTFVKTNTTNPTTTKVAISIWFYPTLIIIDGKKKRKQQNIWSWGTNFRLDMLPMGQLQVSYYNDNITTTSTRTIPPLPTTTTTANTNSNNERLKVRRWYHIKVELEQINNAGGSSCCSCTINVVKKNDTNQQQREIISLTESLTAGSLLDEIDAPFILATGGTLNGRLEDPSIIVTESDQSNNNITEYGLAAWDTSFYSSEKDPWIIPCSKREKHRHYDDNNSYALVLYRHPTRAVKGHKWNGTEFDWRKCRGHYGAIHFHDDDIYDFQWESNMEWTVKEGTPSGIYIVRFVTCDEHKYEEALPIFICSPSNVSQNKLVVLIPTFTYVMYGNHARPDFEEDMWTARTQLSQGAYPYNPCTYPKYGWSTYNFHSDLSGIHFASHLRPLFNLRPGYITFSRVGGYKDDNPDTQRELNTSFCSGLRHFPADSHLICWLHHFGIEYDIITDHELHREGISAISQYSTLVTTSHPEYHTWETIEALQRFQDDLQGNMLYLGGNGFYWRIAASSDSPNSDDNKAEKSCKLLEIRRSESGVRTWAAECGEYYNFLDGGSMGGLWRNSGRPPWQLVGIGFASQGSFVGKPYHRTCFDRPDVTDWVFRGIEDEIIGDFGFSGDGAAGYELDRIDPADPKVVDGEIVILAQAYTKSDRRFILVPEDGT